MRADSASVSGGARALHLQVDGARGGHEEGPAAARASRAHRVALAAARAERTRARPHEHCHRCSYAFLSYFSPFLLFSFTFRFKQKLCSSMHMATHLALCAGRRPFSLNVQSDIIKYYGFNLLLVKKSLILK